MFIFQGICEFEILLQTKSKQSPESEAETRKGTRSRRLCLVFGVLQFCHKEHQRSYGKVFKNIAAE